MNPVKLVLSLATSALAASAAAQATSGRPDPSRVWIDRPWEFRYVLIVESVTSFESRVDVENKTFASGKPIQDLYIQPYAYFDPTRRIKTVRLADDSETDNRRNLVVLTIEFDEDGAVITPNRAPAKLFGRLNRIEKIVLAAGNLPTDFQVDIGELYVGPDSGAEATPAICNMDDTERRYKPRAQFDDLLGRFGCREWGHYLQNPRYPYIDVTSYEPKKFEFLEYWEFDPQTGKDELHTTDVRIAEFIGWGRFDIPPKPVIGQHVGKWFCLHECPDGEAPGLIPDIRAWADKRGWPVPKRPKRMPMFPDPPRKAGSLID
jgi:hypothetical protein